MFLISQVEGDKFTNDFSTVGQSRTQPQAHYFIFTSTGNWREVEDMDFGSLKMNLILPSFLGDFLLLSY